jgi:cytochrome c
MSGGRPVLASNRSSGEKGVSPKPAAVQGVRALPPKWVRAAARVLLAVASAGLLHSACSTEPVRIGRDLIDGFGCGSCHVIPGASAATGTIGPSLEGVGARAYIAGSLTNTHDNLTLWIMSPQQIHPGTAMPDLGVTEEQAEAIATYLRTLR